MSSLETLTLVYPQMRIDRDIALEDGLEVYKRYLEHTEATTSTQARLAYCLRRIDNPYVLNHEGRKTLERWGYLRRGETLSLRRRLTHKGALAIAMVALEIENEEIVSEEIQEPFKEIAVLDDWYRHIRGAASPDLTQSGVSV